MKKAYKTEEEGFKVSRKKEGFKVQMHVSNVVFSARMGLMKLLLTHCSYNFNSFKEWQKSQWLSCTEETSSQYIGGLKII